MTSFLQQLPALSILPPRDPCFCPFAAVLALKCSRLCSHLAEGIGEQIQVKYNHWVS